MSLFIAVNEAKYGPQIRSFAVGDVESWYFFPASPAGVNEDDDDYLAVNKLVIELGQGYKGERGTLFFTGLAAEIVRDELLDYSKMVTVYEPEPTKTATTAGPQTGLED